MSDFTREPPRVIAFATAVIVALLGDLAIVLYSKRRAPGRYLTWGEAMAGRRPSPSCSSTSGTASSPPVDHPRRQGVGLALRPDPLRPVRPLQPDRFIPFTISYQALRDIVVTLIYGVALGLHIFHWAQWQNRAKPKAEIVPTTTYGRPLARKG